MPATYAARRWIEADGTHIDVRGLPPPQPLVQILQLIAGLEPGTAVTAHLDRDPQMLYPELAQIGWWAEPIAGDTGEVRLRLTAAP